MKNSLSCSIRSSWPEKKTIEDLLFQGSAKENERRPKTCYETDCKKDSSTKVKEQKKSRQELQIKRVKVTKKLIAKMLEATSECTLDFFRQFAEQYCYFICQSEPDLITQ